MYGPNNIKYEAFKFKAKEIEGEKMSILHLVMECKYAMYYINKFLLKNMEK